MTVQDVILNSVEHDLTPKQTIQALKKNGFKLNSRKKPWREVYIRYMQTKVKPEAVVEPAESITPSEALKTTPLRLSNLAKQCELMNKVLATDYSDATKLDLITRINENKLTAETFTKTIVQGDSMLIQIESLFSPAALVMSLYRWQARELLSAVDDIKAFVESDPDHN